MTDQRWVQIRSWHAVRLFSDRGAYTRCGRVVTGHQIVDVLPPGKSCENCLRIVGRSQDVPF